jgi:hypothetical protein
VSDPQSAGVNTPTLVMTGGPLDGTSYTLEGAATKDITLGSSMDADIQIMLGNVEPYHARVTTAGEGLRIADAGSATGTFVNGEKVEGEQTLQEGDRICLGPPGAKGSAKLVVRMPSGAGAAPAPPSEGQGATASPFFGAEAPPLIIDDGDQAPPLTLDSLDPAAQSPGSEPPPGPPPAAAPPPPPPPPPPSSGGDDTADTALTGDEVLAAEVVDDTAPGPPLEAMPLSDDDGDALFDKPLPPRRGPLPLRHRLRHPLLLRYPPPHPPSRQPRRRQHH